MFCRADCVSCSAFLHVCFSSMPRVRWLVSTKVKQLQLPRLHRHPQRHQRAPATFTPDGVIPGWFEALQLMRAGDKWEIVVPSALGYGAKGSGKKIPADSVLKFSIELMSFREATWMDSKWLSAPYVVAYFFVAFQLASIVDGWWGGSMPEGCGEVGLAHLTHMLSISTQAVYRARQASCGVCTRVCARGVRLGCCHCSALTVCCSHMAVVPIRPCALYHTRLCFTPVFRVLYRFASYRCPSPMPRVARQTRGWTWRLGVSPSAGSTCCCLLVFVHAPRKISARYAREKRALGTRVARFTASFLGSCCRCVARYECAVCVGVSLL